MAQEQAVVETRSLTKRYGSARGVADLTFDVRPGEVFGLLGPNGAGKTTVIRTMLDLIRPTSGSVRILGMDPRTDVKQLHREIGYLPGEFKLYERMTARDYLSAMLQLRGIEDRDGVYAMTERLGVDLDRHIRTLSHGNKQKIGLIQAFMHKPQLLILDEPTQGLDPLMQQQFYAMVEEARQRGTTVLLSSHVMPEVERVCDRVAILREGSLVDVADVGELKARAKRKMELHFEGPADAAAFSSLPGVTDVEVHGESLSLSIAGPVDQVVKTAARYTVVSITAHDPTLEDVFLAVYSDDHAEMSL